MTPKEQIKAFYDHKYSNGQPSMEGLFILPDPFGVGERPPFYQDGTDWFGVKWKRDEGINAIAPDATQELILKDICDWKEVIKWPDLDAYDWSVAREWDHLDDIDRENKMVLVFCDNGPFERLHMLMGFEDALMALIEEPEEVEEFFDAFMEWKLKLLEKMKEVYNPDIIMFHDDWGAQKAPFFSPATWRELIKPQIKKAVDKCHELGMYYEQHSCGNIEALVPDFVEMGIDAWQGQEINDIQKLKEITEGKLEFHTMPIYQEYVSGHMAGSLTLDQIKEKTKEGFDANLPGGHYLPLMIPFGDSVTNLMFDELNALNAKVCCDPE